MSESISIVNHSLPKNIRWVRGNSNEQSTDEYEILECRKESRISFGRDNFLQRVGVYFYKLKIKNYE